MELGKRPALASPLDRRKLHLDGREARVRMAGFRFRLSQQRHHRRQGSLVLLQTQERKAMTHFRQSSLVIRIPSRPAMAEHAVCDPNRHTMLAGEAQEGASM